jgi:hypothetical protein
MTVRIEPARGEDLQEILAQLEENELPQEGLGDHLATTLVAWEGPRIVGSTALELYGPDVLLRSVALRRDLQGCGLGSSSASGSVPSLARWCRRALHALWSSFRPVRQAPGRW